MKLNNFEIKNFLLQNREIILVDHNKLDEKQIFLKELVTEIIDHHVDFDCQILYRNIKRKSIVFPLGSCSTLVLIENLINLEKYLFYEEIKIKEVESFFRNSFKDFLIFIAAVLIDTRNFLEDDFNVRWSNLDILAFNRIIEMNKRFFSNEFDFEKKEIIKISNKFYENLINSKYDEDSNLNLGIKKLLNKDMKEFSYDNKIRIIWSSLQVPLEKIIEKEGLENLKYEINYSLLNKELYVINYRKIENGNSYTFIAFFINYKNDEKNLDLNTFCIKLDSYLKNEMINDYFDFKILEDTFCLIKLNPSITRKNFEPHLNKLIKNLK